MPIRINLLAELQSAEEARRRDPVKRVAFVVAALVIVALLWAGWIFMQLQTARGIYQTEDARWKKNEPAFKTVTDEQKQVADIEQKLTAVTRFSTSRFLWAPVLNGLQQAIVSVADDIQFEYLKGLQTFEQIAATPASKDKKTPAKPASSVEHGTLTIRARDYGNQSKENYNALKKSISDQSYLKTILQKNDGVRLASTLSAPQSDPNDPSKSFYQFTLECRFQEVKRDE